jgi:hypothetical protein
MDDIRQTAIDRFRAYLERRQFSAHTVANGSSTLNRGAGKLQRKQGSRHTSRGNVSTHSQENCHGPHDCILPQ